MPEELTAEQAAARLKTDDTLGMPLGPGQPPAFLRAFGQREDWTDLRVYGALLACRVIGIERLPSRRENPHFFAKLGVFASVRARGRISTDAAAGHRV